MKERILYFFKVAPLIAVGEVALGVLATLFVAAAGADGDWSAFSRAIPPTAVGVFWPLSVATAAYLAAFLLRTIAGPIRGGDREPVGAGTQINPATGYFMTSEYGLDVGGYPYGVGPGPEEH